VNRRLLAALITGLSLVVAAAVPGAGAPPDGGGPPTLLAGADARSIVPMRDGEVDLTNVYMGGFGLGPYRVFDPDYEPITYVGENRPARDVHPLGIRVQSMAFGSPAGDVVVVQSLDLQGYFIQFKECPCGVASIQELFEAQTGIDGTHLLVHSTHQHAGPNTLGHQGGVPRWYLEQVRDTAVASAVQAVAELEPAAVVTGSLHRPQYNQHRRETYESVADPMLVYLHATAAADRGRAIGTLVNYSGHPTVLGSDNQTIHPDYPGPLVRAIERQLGGVGVFLNGGVGNTSVRAPSAPDDFERAHRLGEALALEVVEEVARDPRPVLGDTVAAAVLRMEHPITNPVLTAGNTLNVYMRSEEYLTVSAEPLPYPTGAFPLRMVTTVGGFRVGDALVLWGPGEIFSAITISARNQTSWASGTLVAGLGNDHAGYIMQNHEYKVMQAQEYEETQSIDPWVGDHVIDLMLEAAATLQG
jgi:hypothetical protein